MNAENQELLSAIRGIVAEAVAPLETRFDSLETRLAMVEGSIRRLEDLYETLDARINQMMTDLLYLRERVPLLDDHIANGFRMQKNDVQFAFSDMRRLTETQKNGDTTLAELQHELFALQQRIATLEAARQ